MVVNIEPLDLIPLASVDKSSSEDSKVILTSILDPALESSLSVIQEHEDEYARQASSNFDRIT